MRIYFSPMVYDKVITYTFNGDVIEASMDGITDTFDFTGLPDGRVRPYTIETSLPVQPIISAEKVGNILYVELLNPISSDATEFEKFPEWIEVGEE